MSDESALLRAIITSPADIAARLVFSDWLEEHGRTPQADFIRTQIRLDGLRPFDEGYDELKHREIVLRRQHTQTWLDPIRPFLHRSFEDGRDESELGVFRRGFVETAFVDAERFLADPDGLLDAAPITGLVFWVRSPLLPKILDCAALRRVERLRFMSWRTRVCSAREQNIELNPGDFQLIAECPHLARLQELDLTAQHIPPAEVAALVGSRHLANLQTLKLTHRAVTNEGFDAIGSSMKLPALRHLYLNNNYDSGRLQSWNKKSWPRQLRTLDLTSCGLDIEETASFLAEAPWPELETLSLQRLEGTAARGSLGGALQGMPRLRFLDLEGRRFGQPARALAGGRFEALESLNLGMAFTALNPGKLFSSAFPNLKCLVLNNNQLKGGLAALADSTLPATLRWLDVRNCATTLDDTLSFAKMARMPALDFLSIGNNKPYTPRTLAALGAAEGFPRLRTLRIRLSGGIKIYQALATTPLLSRLSHLQLDGGTVSTSLVKILIESPGFQHLSSLRFWGTSINMDNRKRLQDHFGERFIG